MKIGKGIVQGGQLVGIEQLATSGWSLFRSHIATFHFPEAAVFNDDPVQHEELQRRLEGAGRQLLAIEESLQPLQISPLGLSFANDNVARGGHRGGLEGRVRHAGVEAGEVLFSEVGDVADVLAVVFGVHEAAD